MRKEVIERHDSLATRPCGHCGDKPQVVRITEDSGEYFLLRCRNRDCSNETDDYRCARDPKLALQSAVDEWNEINNPYAGLL